MNVIVFLVVLFIGYCLWTRTVGWGLKKLQCRRSFSKPAVFAGEEGKLVEVVRNDTPWILPWMRLESRVSPHIRLGNQENLHVSGEMYYCSLFTLLPYQQIRRTHRVRFLHRGAYDLGNASLTAGDMLGLGRYSQSQMLSAPVLVFPRLLEANEVPQPVAQLMGELSGKQQLLRDPFLVRGIRGYVPGDPVRDIHWPATARMGQAQVRIRDFTVRTRLLVLLNVQHEDQQWNNVVPEKIEDVMEHAISMAATLCVNALRDGLAAGFGTNMAGENDAPVLMLPEDGAAREEQLLTAMAYLRLYRAEHFSALLDKLTAYSDMDILIFSLYDSATVQERIRQLRQNGNHVTLHILEGGLL